MRLMHVIIMLYWYFNIIFPASIVCNYSYHTTGRHQHCSSTLYIAGMTITHCMYYKRMIQVCMCKCAYSWKRKTVNYTYMHENSLLVTAVQILRKNSLGGSCFELFCTPQTLPPVLSTWNTVHIRGRHKHSRAQLTNLKLWVSGHCWC